MGQVNVTVYGDEIMGYEVEANGRVGMAMGSVLGRGNSIRGAMRNFEYRANLDGLGNVTCVVVERRENRMSQPMMMDCNADGTENVAEETDGCEDADYINAPKCGDCCGLLKSDEIARLQCADCRHETLYGRM